MKKLQFTGTMIRYEKRNNSYYGNPKYMLVFENEKGDYLIGNTASNASCAYSCLNNQTAKKVITYHETKTGNVIIDYIEEV
jgi:hypothetical protein